MFSMRLIVLGRVIRMERGQHEVAGEGRLDADLGRFIVAGLADHDDVRVLAQEGPERSGKVEPDLVLHLHLVDAHEVELDRVLGRHDVLRVRVEFAQRRVQRRRLSASRRSRNEHHAIRPVQGVFKVLELVFIEPELRHVKLQVRFVQQPHDDLFAEQGGKHGNAEVHYFVFAHFELDAAVLRKPALGDVEDGHDLDAGDDGVLDLHGKAHDRGQHAVQAVPHPELLFIGFDMNIAHAHVRRAEQDAVHELDDRRLDLAGELVQRLIFHDLKFFDGAMDQVVEVVDIDLAARIDIIDEFIAVVIVADVIILGFDGQLLLFLAQLPAPALPATRDLPPP